MKQYFENFGSSDYIEGACLTLENAKKHIIVSELLKKEGLFGIAISHLILGSEEYIKSFLLLNLSGVDDFLNENEKVELFKNHKFKHKNIEELLKSLTNEATDEFETGLFDRLVNNEEPNSKFSIDGFYMNKVFNLTSLTTQDVNKILNWLKKANDLKNNGFYINLHNSWESPDRFTLTEYEEAFKIVEILKNTIEPLFTLPLTDDDLINYFNSKNIF
nr:AbiV family abortive infection protein [uncultured Flavobacterium sp.]